MANIELMKGAHLMRRNDAGELVKEKNPVVRMVLEVLNMLGVRTEGEVNAKRFSRALKDDNVLGIAQYDIDDLSGIEGVAKIRKALTTLKTMRVFSKSLKLEDSVAFETFSTQMEYALTTKRFQIEDKIGYYSDDEIAEILEFRETVITQTIPEFTKTYSEGLDETEVGLTNELKREVNTLEEGMGSVLHKFNKDRSRNNPEIVIGNQTFGKTTGVEREAKEIARFLGVAPDSDWAKAAQYAATQAIPTQFTTGISGVILMEASQISIDGAYPNIMSRDDKATIELIPVRDTAGKLERVHVKVTYDTELILKDSRLDSDDLNAMKVLGSGVRYNQEIDLVQKTDGFHFENYAVGFEEL